MKKLIPTLALLALVFCHNATADFNTELKQAIGKEVMAVAGQESWLFLRDELLHLSKGPLTTESSGPAIAAITNYNKALAAEGVQLIVLPVPAKAEIYPDKFSSSAKPGQLTGHQTAFQTALKAAGVSVIDLAQAFQKERSSNATVPLYCQRDAHWTPAAMRLAAGLAVKEVKDRSWLGTAATEPAEETIEITGDLMTTPETLALGVEKIAIRRHLATEGAESDASLILLGDSHNLVFSGGADSGFHCKAAGFPDILQAVTGKPLLLVANAGGGTDAARTQLARKALPDPAFWKSKKVVIWSFSIREVTEKKWKDIPIKR